MNRGIPGKKTLHMHSLIIITLARLDKYQTSPVAGDLPDLQNRKSVNCKEPKTGLGRKKENLHPSWYTRQWP